MSTTASTAPATRLPAIAEVDASRQDKLTPEQAQAFREAGLLIIRGLLRGEELAALQRETMPMVDHAQAVCAGRTTTPEWDVHHVLATRHAQTGQLTPYRQEYPCQRSQACRLLLAHPFILGSVELLQGTDFTPTWDSLVFKYPGHGAIIPWHRDGEPPAHLPSPVFNVDFYLDASDLTNCVWGIPGSHLWTQEAALAECQRRNAATAWEAAGAVPVPMQPGDVLLHDIKALHGSPWAQSTLRRVLYYEFRAAEVILGNQLRTPAYVKRKQLMLKSLIAQRAAQPQFAGERPHPYAPVAGEWNSWELPAGWVPPTYEYVHEDYTTAAVTY